MFTLNRHYTRDEIHAKLGGSKVSCLPTVDGTIVAACLLRSLSPRAPAVVLCGRGVRTSVVSRSFAAHDGVLPVFIKLAASRWRFAGLFSVARSFTAGASFERFIAGSGRSRESVSCVVLMEPA